MYRDLQKVLKQLHVPQKQMTEEEKKYANDSVVVQHAERVQEMATIAKDLYSDSISDAVDQRNKKLRKTKAEKEKASTVTTGLPKL